MKASDARSCGTDGLLKASRAKVFLRNSCAEAVKMRSRQAFLLSAKSAVPAFILRPPLLPWLPPLVVSSPLSATLLQVSFIPH
jgi:hypothetical protein